ncbi:MAG: 16S rRNA (uracil(1498)-N(3))-methyltransferase [Acidobacteria bacterium]|nr:MAG: 16S rRNA (uracil(1498)-N(3))-methyltransferase [Acidobacteriota bacterium]
MYRFYAPAFREDAVFDLPEDEAQHLRRVLRLRSGDTIAVFDGRGREAVARVESVTPRRVSVRSVEPRSAAPEPKVAVTLAQALLKSDKMDRVIRDAVMLGIAAVQPFVSRRTDVPLKAMGAGGRQNRWERTVVSSVKQCGRAVVPVVHPTREFPDVLRAAAGETRLMFVEPGAGVELAELASLEGQQPSSATVLIGPEGGWDAQEVRDAAAAGVTLLSFGGRVLRADAAAAAVIAVLRYLWRDL